MPAHRERTYQEGGGRDYEQPRAVGPPRWLAAVGNGSRLIGRTPPASEQKDLVVLPPEVDGEIIDGGDLYLPAAHGDALYAVCSPIGGLEFYYYRVGIFRFRRESEYLDGDAFFLRAFKGFLNAGIVDTHAQKPGDDPGIRHVALVGFGQGPVVMTAF